MIHTGTVATHASTDSSQGPYHPPIPHLPLECSCATLPGPVGDYTRWRMDELGRAYDVAVRKLVEQWDTERNSSFAAIW